MQVHRPQREFEPVRVPSTEHGRTPLSGFVERPASCSSSNYDRRASEAHAVTIKTNHSHVHIHSSNSILQKLRRDKI